MYLFYDITVLIILKFVIRTVCQIADFAYMIAVFIIGVPVNGAVGHYGSFGNANTVFVISLSYFHPIVRNPAFRPDYLVSTRRQI